MAAKHVIPAPVENRIPVVQHVDTSSELSLVAREKEKIRVRGKEGDIYIRRDIDAVSN
jgi:hypothetical protein